MPDRNPFEVVAQKKMLKSGLLGRQAVMWSRYNGPDGYPASPLLARDGEPMIFTFDEEHLDDRIGFAAGYLCGWVERLGGDLDLLEIWLEKHEDASSTD